MKRADAEMPTSSSCASVCANVPGQPDSGARRLTLNASGLLFSTAPDCQRQRRFSRSSSGCLLTRPQKSRILLAPAYMFRASAFVRTRDVCVSSSRVAAEAYTASFCTVFRLSSGFGRASWPLLPGRLCVCVHVLLRDVAAPSATTPTREPTRDALARRGSDKVVASVADAPAVCFMPFVGRPPARSG
ncbi:hypothetical protein MRX96_051441 [Rhipicephalus microplus]